MFAFKILKNEYNMRFELCVKTSSLERILTLDISSPVKMNCDYMKNESLVHSKWFEISWNEKLRPFIYLSIHFSLNEILLSITVWCVWLWCMATINEAFVLYTRISIAREFFHILVSIFGSLMSSIDVFAERFRRRSRWFVWFQEFSQPISLKCVYDETFQALLCGASSQMVIK